jgi:octaprenyl-diphosphate synthase
VSLVERSMAEVERILDRELTSAAPFVGQLLSYVRGLSGKRLRPVLLLLSGHAVGRVHAAHYVLGAVVEMIHTATLVHDDILDEADLRRHRATVNARWDNQASVLLGDYLFTHAFYLASTVGNTLACRIIGQTTNVVCEGELRQIGSRGNFGLSEREYLEMIGAKTAELCACCCQLGAEFAEAPPDICQALRRYGHDLGMAFQLVDDLLDLAGETEVAGKSLGTDLLQQKTTLPIIHLVRQGTPKERAETVELLRNARLGEETRETIVALLKRHGSLEYARQRAVGFAESACRHLRVLVPSRERDGLAALAEFAVSRSA